VLAGVSNFGLSEMAELLKLAKIKPAVLETRSDPFAINHHIINLAVENNITFVGYSSLGTQWINSPAAINPVFINEVLQVSNVSSIIIGKHFMHGHTPALLAVCHCVKCFCTPLLRELIVKVNVYTSVMRQLVATSAVNLCLLTGTCFCRR
jgi:hypothetical protein